MSDTSLDRRLFRPRIFAALIALAALQGCVAAVIPVIAGGAALRERIDDGGGSEESATGEAEAAEKQIAEKQKTEDVTSASPSPKQLSMAEMAAADIAAQTAKAKVLSAAALAGEDGDSPISGAASLIPAPVVFAEMTAYVLSAVNNSKAEGADQSALLINPSRLDAQRTKCANPGNRQSSNRPPAVLIDLDDKNGIFDPTAIVPTYDGDSYGHLSRLREAGVTIGWMSALTAGDAGSIRAALQASGLDVEGQDELVLFRYPGDRKQTRRSEFGAEHCLMAIAGDERADFDELYQYLVRSDRAAPLEPLIGNGWFLLPTGLSMRSAPDDEEEAGAEASGEQVPLQKAETKAETDETAGELPPVN